MFETQLKGSYYEMGAQMGALLQQGGFQPEPITEKSTKRMTFANQCEPLIQQHCPGMIDYLKGFAEGGQFDYERIKLIPMVLMYGAQVPPSCTICYVSSQDSSSGYPFLFRNYDWDYTSENVSALRHTHPQEGFKAFTFTDLWAGCYGGMNEKGLIVGITAAPSYTGDWKPGVSMNLLVQWVLDHFASTEEAITYLTSVPHMGAFHFVIVDQSRDIARILATPEKVAVERFHDQNTVQTNHVVNQEMLSRQDPKKIPPSSPIRFNNVQTWLKTQQGQISAEKIQDFCKQPIPDGGIHEDAKWEGIAFGTIWSWYFDFETRSFYAARGNPLSHAYEKVEILP